MTSPYADGILPADVVAVVPDPTGPILLRRPVVVPAGPDGDLRAGLVGGASPAALPPGTPADPAVPAETVLLLWLSALIVTAMIALTH